MRMGAMATSWWSKVRDRTAAITGGRALAVAGAAGAVGALAFPPVNCVPALWLSFPLLAFLLRGAASARRAFALGWFFAFGLMVVSLYWIAGSLFVDIGRFWWALPFAVAGLPAGFAVYYALATLVAWKLDVTKPGGVAALGLLWFTADVARGTLFTGFPWDLLGYVWSFSLPVLQVTSVIGIYGLSLATALLAFAPAAWGTRCGRRGFAFWSVFFIACAIFGAERLKTTPTTMVDDVRLRVVQEGIPQTLKWQHARQESNFRTLLEATFAPSSGAPPTHIIWPETATPYYLLEDPVARAAIAARMPLASMLLTGVVRRHIDEAGHVAYFNALVAMDARGRVVAGYDKVHLVPFGEFMPWRSILPLATLAGTGADFTPGDGARSLRVQGIPLFSPLICYESIFSGQVVDREDPPAFLLNVTNDAWYEHTTGPAQHFAIARVRAIEEGLPLVRSANLGTTGVVDSLGRRVALREDIRPGFIDSPLPRPLEGVTPFVRFGNLFVVVMGIIVFLTGGFVRFFACRRT
jgi:apolipoprotein N-acyltransferase